MTLPIPLHCPGRRGPAAAASLLLTLGLSLGACGSSGSDGEPEAAPAAGDALLPDGSGTETGPEPGPGAQPEPDIEELPEPDVDAEVDAAEEPLPELTLTPTLGPPVELPLPEGVESCGLYLEERCDEASGARFQCDIFDSGAGAFDEDPDPLLRRTYLYDRWYDLYTSPDGQTVKRVLKSFTPGDTPEAEWGTTEHFDYYRGAGDAAIWTGVALNADIFRWQVTGSDADWERVLKKVRQVVRLFDVTGVPGYLARYHFLVLPSGSPKTEGFIALYGEPGDLDHSQMPIEEPATIEGLPSAYLEGLSPEEGGAPVLGLPMWKGVVSIDQYTGPFVALPMVLPFLEDEALVERITHHMTCYIKRLRRLEIRNLHQNPEALEGLSKLFGDGTLDLDPDDIDLTAQETIVGYYHEGLNSKNIESFDRSCPGEMALEPTRVLDATSDEFFFEMFELGLDLDSKKQFREGQIDHFYAVNVRGADASHLMHMVALAYWLTGEEHYRSFLFEELVGNLSAIEVALTAQAFRAPRWCYKYYADHISYGTHWQFITMLPEGPLKEAMVRVMHEEHWLKGLKPLNNAKFDVLYASVVPEEVAGEDRNHAIEEAAELLASFGGNDLETGVLDSPRRDYLMPRQHVVDSLPESIDTVCPTAEERQQCEEPGDVLGIPLDGKTISYPCDGRPAECVMDDGLCVEAIASEGLPVPLRPHGGFLWQLDPLRMGDAVPNPGTEQSHGRDLAEPYWMARYYGYIPEGAGRLLAWRELGACQEPNPEPEPEPDVTEPDAGPEPDISEPDVGPEPDTAQPEGPVAGTPCHTTGASDWNQTCVGDDLLFCVCNEWSGSDCPTEEGTWTKQDILCTCAEYMAGTCPIP